MLDFSFSWEISVLFLLHSCKAEKRKRGKERGKKAFPIFDVQLVDCRTTLCQPSQGYVWFWPVKLTLFERLEKEGIMRWGESGRVQYIRSFYFAVEQKHHSLSNVSEKIKIIKKPASWNNSSLQPRHLWVLTFCWLLFCDALCVHLWRSGKRASKAERSQGKYWRSRAEKPQAQAYAWVPRPGSWGNSPLVWGWAMGLWIFLVKKIKFEKRI